MPGFPLPIREAVGVFCCQPWVGYTHHVPHSWMPGDHPQYRWLWPLIFSNTFRISLSLIFLPPSQSFHLDLRNLILWLTSSFALFTKHFFYLLSHKKPDFSLRALLSSVSKGEATSSLTPNASEAGGGVSILLVKIPAPVVWFVIRKCVSFSLITFYISPSLSSTNIPVGSYLLKIGTPSLQTSFPSLSCCCSGQFNLILVL